jgi:hypothetical protein
MSWWWYDNPENDVEGWLCEIPNAPIIRHYDLPDNTCTFVTTVVFPQRKP